MRSSCVDSHAAQRGSPDRTAIAIPVGGWYLSDDREDLEKWALPAGEVLAPGEFLVVFAGGILPTQLLNDAGIHIQRHRGKDVEQLERQPMKERVR